MRSKQEQKIHHNHIVVGDLVKIKAGMNIPVDGVVVKGVGICTNESAMNGEPDEIQKETLEVCKHRKEEKDDEHALSKKPIKRPKDLPSPILLSGTQIQTGEGWFLVVVVGKNSCLGKILSKLEQKVESTPL
jgi:P-type Ca2+ transporter type 2C